MAKRTSLRAGGGRFEMRVDPADKARWLVCAGGPNFLSPWVRDLCNREAAKLLPEQAAPPPEKELLGMCPRWMYHRVGVYCPGCDTVIAD